MCGIVGAATRCRNGFIGTEADMFKDMLYLDAFRGWDSTGVFGVDKHSNVQIHKEASQAANFLQTVEFKQFKNDLVARGLFAVGHNRAATRGAVTDKNAHPFWIDDKIVLVQNGTWRGDHKSVKDTEVDTEALAHIIAENADIETALQKVSAAYALCWFNTETHSLHIVRNHERPMWLAESSGGALFWASESGFIQLAAMRNNVTLKDKPVLLPTHSLVTLKIDGDMWKREDKTINPFRQTSNWMEEVDEWECGGAWPGRHTYPVQRQQQFPQNAQNQSVVVPMARSVRHSCIPSSPEMVDKQFSDVAFANIPDCDAPSEQIAVQCQAVWREWIVDKKSVLVELEDFIPANADANCTTFHVWGRVVMPEGHLAHHALVHWFLYKTNPKDALEYVCKGLYDIVPAHTKREEFPGNTHIVSVMANSNTITLVPVKEVETVQ